MTPAFWQQLCLAALTFGPAAAAPAWTPPPSYEVELPGPPFGVVVTADQWAFVSLLGRREGTPMGIAVLNGGGRRWHLVRTVETPEPPTGMVLTHDGKLLVAAADDDVLLLDVAEMVQGGRHPIRQVFRDTEGRGNISANVTADDRTLFVSQERGAALTVIDLEQARTKGFAGKAILGKVPMGNAPIATAFSPDGRWLYATSQSAAKAWNWPKAVKGEGPGSANLVTEGAVLVVDVAQARIDPARAVVARVPVGGSAVRLALSPSGDRLYVTVRSRDTVVVLDAAKLRTDPGHARLATVPVGSSPVPLALAEEGRILVVGNSDRFAAGPDSRSTLSVVDTARAGEGAAAVIGSIPCGGFPRELRLTPDGQTLLLANFLSRTLQVISLRP